MTKFAVQIKTFRKSLNLTQKAFAEKINITERAYQYYESGAREPNLETLCKIAQNFNVSADYLLGLSDDPTRR